MAKENLEDVIKDLRKSLAWLDLVLSSLNEGVITLEKDLKIHFANDAIASILGVNRIFLLGSPIWEVLPLSLDGKLLSKRVFTNAVKNKNIQSLSGTYNLDINEKKFVVDVEFGDIPKINQTAIIVRDVTKLQQETAYVRLLQEIAVAANESKTFKDAMLTCLQLICNYTKWQVGHVYSIKSTEELISTNIWYFKSPHKFSSFRKSNENLLFKRGNGLPGRVLGTKKPIWISDINKEKNFPRVFEANAVGLKAGVAFPVLTGDEVVAVLEFFSTDVIQPNEPLLEVMTHVGTQLGRVIERIRIEEEKIKVAKEQAARAKAEIAQKNLHNLFMEAPALIAILKGREGRVTLFNPLFSRLWGGGDQ